jgi:hypothetical protein
MFQEYDWRNEPSTKEIATARFRSTKRSREAACESRHLDVAIGPGKGPHVASFVCAECGKWIKWLSKKQLLHETVKNQKFPPASTATVDRA